MNQRVRNKSETSGSEYLSPYGRYDDIRRVNKFLKALEAKDQSIFDRRPLCKAIQKAWREYMTKFYERHMPSEFLDHTFQDFLRNAPARLMRPRTLETATTLMVYFGTNVGVANIQEILCAADSFDTLIKRAGAAIGKFTEQNFLSTPGYSNYLWFDHILGRLATRDDIDVAHMVISWLCDIDGNNLLWDAIKAGRLEVNGDGRFTPPNFKFLEEAPIPY